MKRTLILSIALCALVAQPGCSKKNSAKTASAKTAGAKTAVVAAAGAAAKNAAKAGAAVKAIAQTGAAKLAPAPKDVTIAEDAGVVAWLSIKSIGALFDAGETIAKRLGKIQPGQAPRAEAYNALTKLLAGQGITGHEWLDKTKPVHVAMQDDDKTNPQGGIVVLLPVTDAKKALGALAAAKTGAEAKGHAALLAAVGKTVFVDMIDGYMVLTTVDGRFKKITAFAKRLSKLQPPALAYLGLSLTEAGKTRKAEIDAMLKQLDHMSQRRGIAAMPMNSDYYGKMLREWISDLQRMEILVNANGENVEIGWRLHAKPGTRIAKQMLAGKGRSAGGLAATLPGNSYLAFVANMDPLAATGQLEDSMKVLQEAFKLDDATMKQLQEDIRSTTKMQTGESFAAAYPDGDAALGLVVGAGASDPAAMIKVMKKLTSTILLRLIEMQEAKAKKRDPKAPSDPKMAIVKKAVREMRVTPLLEAFGGIAKEAGVTVTSNTSKDAGVTCDILDLTMDWAKLAKSGAGPAAARAAKVIGPRTALALCGGGHRVVVSVGPSALEQGRRAAAAKPGGLADAPVFKAALKRSVANPAWYMYVNAGATLKAFEKALPRPIAMPADRAVSLGCGNRERSFGCELDVPVAIIKAAMALAPGGR